ETSEGMFFELRGGEFVPVAVGRSSSGPAQFYAVAFDAAGHGWIGGRRFPHHLFLAGNLTGEWLESRVEAEAGAGWGSAAGGRNPETGGEVLSIAVLAKDRAFAVGTAEESDLEGGREIIPRILELVTRPPGEVE